METKLRLVIDKDWITLVIFASVLFLVIAKSFFYSRFLNYLILPFNNKYIFMYNKKDRLQNWFHVFFTIFFILNASLFVYYAIKVLFKPDSGVYAFSYLIVLGAVVLLLLFKTMVQLAGGFVFNTNRAITEIIFKKLSYLNYSGLVMLLANISLTYIWANSKIVIYVGILLISLINLAGWVTLMRNHQKLISSNLFYFILYLCALEIAPFVIIGSYF